MRIKVGNFLLGFITIQAFLCSCLGSTDNETEYSLDATVRAFAIDSVYNVAEKDSMYVTFDIDQLNHVIFNQDSLPYGSESQLDSIRIKTMTVSGYITSGLLDTVFTAPKLVDLTTSINSDNGLKFVVHSPDGSVSNQYLLKVNVHRQDPDSMVWKPITTLPTGFETATLSGNQKTVAFGNTLLIYDYSNLSSIRAFVTPTSALQWSTQSVNGLPQDIRMSSLVQFSNKLFANTQSGDVYSSADGLTWSKVPALSNHVVTLVAGLEHSLAAIVQVEGESYYATSKSEQEEWTIGEKAETGFPIENLYAAVFYNGAGLERAIVTGGNLASETSVLPWLTQDGLGWAKLESSSTAFSPLLKSPAVFYYNNRLYMLGAGLRKLYSSTTGISWTENNSHFVLDPSMDGAAYFSVTIDQENYIWMVTSGNGSNRIWKGRLNKYGFKNQD